MYIKETYTGIRKRELLNEVKKVAFKKLEHDKHDTIHVEGKSSLNCKTHANVRHLQDPCDRGVYFKYVLQFCVRQRSVVGNLLPHN